MRVYVETPGLARLVLHEVRTGPDYDSLGLHALQVRYTQYVRLALEQAINDGELDAGVDFEMIRSVLYGGLEHLLWPLLHGKHPVHVDELADRYTELMLHGLQPARRSNSVDARLARLEALLAATAPTTRRIKAG